MATTTRCLSTIRWATAQLGQDHPEKPRSGEGRGPPWPHSSSENSCLTVCLAIVDRTSNLVLLAGDEVARRVEEQRASRPTKSCSPDSRVRAGASRHTPSTPKRPSGSGRCPSRPSPGKRFPAVGNQSSPWVRRPTRDPIGSIGRWPTGWSSRHWRRPRARSSSQPPPSQRYAPRIGRRVQPNEPCWRASARCWWRPEWRIRRRKSGSSMTIG